LRKKIAAVDIGTNSFHLVVARFDPRTSKFKILDREKEIVRLGSSSSDMKYLTAEAMDRGIETLKQFKRISDSHGAFIRAIGTSAVREALNRDRFISRVRSETGINIEVVSGYEEARLIYLGVLQALPLFHRRMLMIDIGGGSTEFLVGERREVHYSNSLKLGAIRLTRMFFEGGELTDKAVKKCRKYISGMLIPVVRDVSKYGFEIAVGSSGTVLNALQIAREKRAGEGSMWMNGLILKSKDLDKAVEKVIKASKPAKIADIPGADPRRADILGAGLIILEQIFSEFGIKQMTVSDFALREGILLDTIEKRSGLRTQGYLRDVKYKSIIHLAGSFNIDRQHALSVSKLALRMFDQLRPLHGLEPADREYLEYAAILHDIGMFVSHSQHHRHTYYLIRNSELLGFTENDKEIIANIARYHRKSHPRIKHEGFSNLAEDDRKKVCLLSSILRIADGLDRSHASAVANIDCKIKGGKVVCRLETGSKPLTGLEIWGAERKKQLFEEVFEKKIVFEK